MKNSYNLFSQQLLLFGFLFLSLAGNAQHFTVTLANFTSTTNTFEVDVVLIVEAPTQGVRLSSLATGIYYNPAILDGGTPCTTIDCGSWEYIPGTRSAVLSTLNITHTTNRANPVGHLRIVQTPAGSPGALGTPVDVLPGTYTFGRFRFTNTVAWTADSDVQLWLSPVNTNGASNTIVNFFPYGTLYPMEAYTTTAPAIVGGVTLGYTQNAPLSRILNSALATPENYVSPLQVVPNPFGTTFQLDFETISNEPIMVKVYDMIGKLIEDQAVEANAINTMQLGLNYPSGIYNVTVSQGEKRQNVKVIKR